MLRLTAFLVHLLGFAADHVGKALKNLYDIVIFLPLKVEESMTSGRSAVTGEASNTKQVAPSA
jgi:hypothetical protein